MMVVIGIIAILAGIILPAIVHARTIAKKQVAKGEMGSLISAISAYEAEYSRPPASRDVEAMLTAARPDYTFGAFDVSGRAVMNPTLPQTFTNDVVMNIIMDRNKGSNQDHKRNSRHHGSFTAQPSDGRTPGLDNNGILRDPWGNPYIITIDMNDDNQADDAFYGLIRMPVVIWSFGPDGKFDDNPTVGKKKGANADNVVSWE